MFTLQNVKNENYASDLEDFSTGVLTRRTFNIDHFSFVAIPQA